GMGFKNVRPAVYAWFFNFFFSLFIYFGYYRIFSRAAGESKIAANVTGEIGIFTFLADIAHRFPGNLSLVFSLALMAAFFFFLVSIFVSAGIYSVMVGDERTTFSNLIASSIENFFNMLKVFLVNILNWLAALIIPGILLVVFLNIKSLALNETILQVFTYIWIGITALIFTFSVAIYDFSRIFRLKEDKNVLYAFKKAIVFTFSNKLNILVIFLMYAVLLVILFLIYAIFNHFLEDLLYVFLLFIIYQVFILVRYFLKVAVMGAEVRLIEIRNQGN
ncbi:MAG: hypothetical protein JSV88_05510, partial [Candidatus Aminicenantes bacterium]